MSFLAKAKYQQQSYSTAAFAPESASDWCTALLLSLHRHYGLMFSISPCSPLVLFKMLSPFWSSTDGPTEVFSRRDSNTVEQAACPGQNRMCSWYTERQGKSEEAGSTQKASWEGLMSNTSNSFCFWKGLKWGICLQKSWYIQEGDKWGLTTHWDWLQLKLIRRHT